jgi:hypothetical protein
VATAHTARPAASPTGSIPTPKAVMDIMIVPPETTAVIPMDPSQIAAKARSARHHDVALEDLDSGLDLSWVG